MIRGKRSRAILLNLILVSVLAIACLTPTGSANAYVLEGCHWFGSSPAYNNVSGTAEVNTAAGKWVSVTDIVTMTNTTGAHLAVKYQALGTTGQAGVTTYTCSGSSMLSATSVMNTTYTNGYSAAKRMAIIVHEIGHGLGLGHSANTFAIMTPCPGCLYDSNGINFPNGDDVTGMNTLY